jgi:hypothetical protein
MNLRGNLRQAAHLAEEDRNACLPAVAVTCTGRDRQPAEHRAHADANDLYTAATQTI